MKLLWLLRHASAERGSPDEMRRLTSRGEEEAHRASERWAETTEFPDLVLCSPARRARATAEIVTGSFDVAPECRIDASLYLASPGTILRALASTEASCRALLLVGHNPGLADLADHLALSGGSAARKLREHGFPPCALARFDLDIDDWADVDGTLASLVEFSDEH